MNYDESTYRTGSQLTRDHQATDTTRSENPTSSGLPFVSVIMPTRDEEAFISTSLGAVLEQDYPRDRYEIIVADGMSTDRTRDIVRSMRGNAPPIHLIDNPAKIVPTAMNRAMLAGRGEIVVRVDGHCKIAQDYLSRCVEHLSRGKADGVGGPIETIGTTWVQKSIAAAMSSPFGVGGGSFRTVQGQECYTDTVPFPAYRRDVIERVGEYDEELVRNQDDEYNYRLRHLGGTLLLAPDVCSEYYSRGTIRSLFRQYFQYGYWKVRVMQKHPRQMRLRHFAPAAFVSCLLLTFALAPWSLAALGGFVCLITTYAIANLFATARLARSINWRATTFLPVAFFTLHLAYGTGFLVGQLRFSHRWNLVDRLKWFYSNPKETTAESMTDATGNVSAAPMLKN